MYIPIFVFFLSFVTVFVTMPRYIKKLRENDHVVRDVYKHGNVMIPTMGGLALLLGVCFSLIVSIFFVEHMEKLLVFYFVVFTYAIFGQVDDLIDIGRFLKLVVPFFLAIPIALLNFDTSLWVFFGEVELAWAYSFMIAPIFIMVVTNMVNMHSGFNGLQSGLSFLVLALITVKALLSGHPSDTVLFILPILGALAAFVYYNSYPARIFEGNVGSMAFGSAIGGYVILFNNLEIFATIILIPHIFNFLLYLYWKARKLPAAKFGHIDEHGMLVVPNPLTLKWIFPYYFKMNERSATYLMYGLTLLFGIIGFAVV